MASSPIPNSNSNNNQFRNERVIFLKELARNADIDIYDLANQLSLSQESVMAYIRSFFKTVAEFSNQDDQLDKGGYTRVKQVINSDVSTEHGGLTDNHIQNLMYVYEKYRKLQPDLYIEADGVKASKSFSSSPKQVSSPSSPTQPQPQQQSPQMIAHSRNDNVDEEFRHVGPQDFNVDRLNKPHNYEFLTKLSRKGLVQWVLEGVPIPISTPKIENYIQYFEVNQDEIFISPTNLRSSLIDWFGDKTGDNAAKLIYSYLKFLPSGEGFGQQKLSGGRFKEGYWSGDNPLYHRPGVAHYPNQGPGNPFAPNDGYSGSGPRMEDPYNTYYHAQGILPFGMNIYSVDARRLINEAEQKRKHKEEQREEQQEMMDMMRNKMSMSYAEMFDAKKFGIGGGGGNGQMGGGANQIFTPEFLQGLVATTAITGIAQGKMQALPTQNPETGKMEVKLVPVSDANAAAMAAAANAPPELGLRDMLDIIKSMYETVDRKRDEAMSFKIDTLKEVYGNKESKDPIQQVGDTFKALKEIVPGLDMKFQGGNGHDIDLHRLLLEKDKFMYDREKTDKIIEHQLSVKDRKEEFEHENELAANKSRNQSLKMISNILASNLPMFIQLIMTFLSMRNPKFAPFASMMGGGGMGGAGGQSGGGSMSGGMGGITDLIGNLLKGVSGGDGSEDEEEEEDFMSTKKKKRRMDEDEEDEEEGGFNLGGLQGMVGQAMDLLRSAGIPGSGMAAAGTAAADANEEEGGGVVIPETHKHTHRHIHRGSGGTRPTFRNVSIGNPNAAVIQTPVPGTEAANAYEDIELQSRKRIALTTPNPTSPTVEDIMNRSIVEGGGVPQEYTNAYGDKIPGDVINEPQVIIPEAVPSATATTTVQQQEEQEGGGEEGGEEEDYPEYSAQDFKDWTVEQLQNARKDGYDAAKSHESYLKSVEEVLRQKESGAND